MKTIIDVSTVLSRIGEALYGDKWQSQMSEAISVSDRTIRRWLTGDAVVPRGVWNDLFVRLDAKRNHIEYLLDRVREEVDKDSSE